MPLPCCSRPAAVAPARVGGAWLKLPAECANATNAKYTSVSTPQAVASLWGYPCSPNADAMPVVFSWPVLPSTVNNTDFQLTLNTGEKVFPDVASVSRLSPPRESCSWTASCAAVAHTPTPPHERSWPPTWSTTSAPSWASPACCSLLP